MKIRVWKMYFFCDDSAETKRYIFEQIELLTEKMLRARFKQAIIDEQFGDYTRNIYNLDENTDENIFAIEKIIEIFKFDGYEIQENILEA